MAVALAAISAIAACESPANEREVEAASWNFSGEPSSVFLSIHGVGNREESFAYYDIVLRGQNPATYTLDKWKSQFLGNEPTVKALYRNAYDLGFWREMTCTTRVLRGKGGCMVTNWGSPTEPGSGVPNKGTVAMTVSPEGIVDFFVFTPDDKLSPSAVLDAEGPKFVPRLCTTCHSGASPEPGKQEDLGSVFREFEPRLLEARPGIDRVVAEQEWFKLNRITQEANLAIRSEREGAAYGTDHAREAIHDRIDTLYIPGGDPDAVPPSWGKVDRETQEVWSKVVVPYCIGCHRHNLLDWTQFEQFEFLRKDGYLREYITRGSRSDVAAMPQAALSFDLLEKDHAAQQAINDWLGDSGPAAGATCATPHEVFTRRCGTCGKSEAYCLPDGAQNTVTEYGACFGEVADGCAPGAVEEIACGTCGKQVRRCTSACTWSVSECTAPPAEPCSPGALDFSNAGCVAGESRVRVCDAFCSYSSFSSTCTADVGGPIPVNVVVGAVNSTIVELSKTQTEPRLTPGTSCAIGTKQTPYAYVELKNSSDKALTVSVYNSAEATASAGTLDTILAAYSAVPATDGARRACLRGVGDVGNASLTGDTAFASLDGANAVTIPAHGSVQVYVASLFSFTQLGLESARVRLDVRTDAAH